MSANRLHRFKSRQILKQFFKDYFGDGDPGVVCIGLDDSSSEIEEGITEVVGCLHFDSVEKKRAFVKNLRTECNLYRLVREVCPRKLHRSISEVQNAEKLRRLGMNFPHEVKDRIESIAEDILSWERLKLNELTWGLSEARGNLAFKLDLMFKGNGFMHRWNFIFDLVEATFPSRNSKANMSDEEKSDRARQWVYRILKEEKIRDINPGVATKNPEFLMIESDD